MGNKKESASLVVGRPEKPSVPIIKNMDGELRTTKTDVNWNPKQKTPTNQT